MISLFNCTSSGGTQGHTGCHHKPPMVQPGSKVALTFLLRRPTNTPELKRVGSSHTPVQLTNRLLGVASL